MKRDILFFIGPTASGKTQLAFELAQFINHYSYSQYSDIQNHIQDNNLLIKKILINSQNFRGFRKFSEDSKHRGPSSKFKGNNFSNANNASNPSDFMNFIFKYKSAIIINIDTMQLYKGLESLSASPSLEMKQKVKHYFYNFLDFHKHYSVISYIENIDQFLKILDKDILPIFVGGSGMYISMLMNGYHHMPNIDLQIKEKVRDMYAKYGNSYLYDLLVKHDGRYDGYLNNSNSQRIIRAAEIFMQSKKSIFDFWDVSKINILDGCDVFSVLILPKRDLLYQNCNRRFTNMIDQENVILEAKKIYQFYLSLGKTNEEILSWLASKTLGFKEIIDFIHGKISKDQMIEYATQNIRRYAKRQITWFKHQIKSSIILETTI